MSGDGILPPEDLRAAVRRVVADYGAFVTREPMPGAHEDPKSFAARHAAAKTALAHLEHLLKLARASLAAAPAGEDIQTLLTQARAEIAAEGEDDDGHDTGDENA
ncbi:hypothetical protein [Roseomonas gilardii]|uniref:hypothetical protein n=1 Tax=Roseomonas gilardii TaxID=257708 RepID=UPI000484D326|nr:hypothetical protein [Roseomonas gilardii]SUE43611.1 Uncharacterised protein [Roseomonas gilardii subsp. rosea]